MGWKQRWLVVKELVWGRVWVRVLLAAWTVAASYDTLNGVISQLLPGTWELPELGVLFMSGSALLPWWGWLLILQAILTASVIEFVVRHISALDSDLEKKVGPLRAQLESFEAFKKQYGTDQHMAHVHRGHTADALGSLQSAIGRVQQHAQLLDDALLVPSQRLREVVLAISEIDRLQGAPEAIATSISKAEVALAALSKVEQRAKAGEGGAVASLPRQWIDHSGICEGALHELKSLCDSISGGSLDTASSPNYDRNPFRKFPGDELFSDDEKRQDFRKMADRVGTAIKQAQAVRTKLVSRLEKARKVIRDFK